MEVGEAVSVAFGMDNKEDKEWVAIRLVYEVKDSKSGRTLYREIGNEKYKGSSPDGPIDGELEGNGVLGLRGVSQGECSIEFSDFYKTMGDWGEKVIQDEEDGRK